MTSGDCFELFIDARRSPFFLKELNFGDLLSLQWKTEKDTEICNKLAKWAMKTLHWRSECDPYRWMSQLYKYMGSLRQFVVVICSCF